jgi:hypothetical protein
MIFYFYDIHPIVFLPTVMIIKYLSNTTNTARTDH